VEAKEIMAATELEQVKLEVVVVLVVVVLTHLPQTLEMAAQDGQARHLHLAMV
jgi:hypothetical protein